MQREIGAEAPHSRQRERLVLLILAAVQFTTIVDFMIVMPLGPQLMRTLGIGTAQFGLIVSSYTFAAGAAGLVASSIVDRYPCPPTRSAPCSFITSVLPTKHLFDPVGS